MNVSEQLIEVLDALCEKFGIAIDWTQNNVLPYIEQLLGKFITWEISTSIFWSGLMLLITLIAFVVAKKVHKRYKKTQKAGMRQEESDWETASWITWIIFYVFAFITVFVVGQQIYDIITCCTFPEMVIFEKAQSLMSSKS